MNNLLETNRTPALWVSNRVAHLDAAHRRRFDLPFFVDIPPTAVRACFLARHATPLGASVDWCERVSRQYRFSPAAISRAARFAGGVRKVDPERSAERLFEEAFTAHVRLAQGRRPNFNIDTDSLAYRYEAVNASVDLQKLVEGLRRDPRCRIALVGPSGTGKSEFARMVARELDKPLMVQRASDLLRPHVGESEMAISEMFERATHDDALLLIDEVDSFLRSRADLKQNWESTMVNEMLTQLETFGGTLFVTSNWAERLDPASLRRFDLKVEFDAMRPQQALQMLGHLCERIGIAFDAAAVRPGDLDSMTPGLFSLVLRQARFRPVTDLNDLIGRLRAEAARAAGDSRRPMGFLVPVAA
jgi:hypothetical protein